MKKINLNADWTFWPKGQEEQAQTVDLPHDAMIHRERIKKLKNGSYTGFYPSGDYVYRKTLFGAEEYRDQSLILEFGLGKPEDKIILVSLVGIFGYIFPNSEFKIVLALISEHIIVVKL